jgi:hypothetical protein
VTRKGRTEFLAFCRYLGSLHPTQVRIAVVLDNLRPHLSTKTDSRVGDWARTDNVELAYVPFYGSCSIGRAPVHRAAILRRRRHRPLQPHRAGQPDPPLHHLAQPPRHRPRLRKVIKRAATIKRAKVA